MTVRKLFHTTLEAGLNLYHSLLGRPLIVIGALILISAGLILLSLSHSANRSSAPSTPSSLAIVFYPKTQALFSSNELCLLKKWNQSLEFQKFGLTPSFHLFQTKHYEHLHNRLVQSELFDIICNEPSTKDVEKIYAHLNESPWKNTWISQKHFTAPFFFQIPEVESFRFRELYQEIETTLSASEAKIGFDFMGEWAQTHLRSHTAGSLGKTTLVGFYLILIIVFLFRTHIGSNLLALLTLLASHVVSFQLTSRPDLTILVFATTLVLRQLFALSHFPKSIDRYYFKEQASSVFSYTFYLILTLGMGAWYFHHDFPEVSLFLKDISLFVLVQTVFILFLFPSLALRFPKLCHKINKAPIEFFSHLKLPKERTQPTQSSLILLISLFGIAAVFFHSYKPLEPVHSFPPGSDHKSWSHSVEIEFQNYENQFANQRVLSEIKKIETVSSVFDPYEALDYPYQHLLPGLQEEAKRMNLTEPLSHHLRKPPYLIRAWAFLGDAEAKNLKGAWEKIQQLCVPSQCKLKGHFQNDIRNLTRFEQALPLWLGLFVFLTFASIHLILYLKSVQVSALLTGIAFLPVGLIFLGLKMLNVSLYSGNWFWVALLVYTSIQELFSRAYLRSQKDSSYVSHYVASILLSVSLFSASHPLTSQLGWCLLFGFLVSFYCNFYLRRWVDHHSWSVKRV